MNMANSRYQEQDSDYQDDSQGIVQRGGIEKINRPSKRPAYKGKSCAVSLQRHAPPPQQANALVDGTSDSLTIRSQCDLENSVIRQTAIWKRFDACRSACRA